jgi:hypothetical protein
VAITAGLNKANSAPFWEARTKTVTYITFIAVKNSKVSIFSTPINSHHENKQAGEAKWGQPLDQQLEDVIY